MDEDTRDCENCKHYVLHDKTVHLPPIYACEEWECKFEPKEVNPNDERKSKESIAGTDWHNTGI